MFLKIIKYHNLTLTKSYRIQILSSQVFSMNQSIQFTNPVYMIHLQIRSQSFSRHGGESLLLITFRYVWFSSHFKLDKGLTMGQNGREDHGASTSDPHTVQNRVLGHTSPTSADLFEIVAISHSEIKRPSSQTSIPSPERLLLCKRMTVSCTLFLS